MKEFEGKVGLVTGTTGIGRGIALRLASGGAQVVACGIDAAANRELQQIADDRKLPLRVELCDVSKPEQWQRPGRSPWRNLAGWITSQTPRPFIPSGIPSRPIRRPGTK